MAKICIWCKKVKELSEFHKGKHCKDGHQPKCKECMAAYHIKRYALKKEHILATTKLYQKTERGRNVQNKSILRTRKKYPEKRAAWIIVTNALATGKLFKQPCEICGDNKVEAHHDDYTKPLEVRWLCPYHHTEFHNNLKKTH